MNCRLWFQFSIYLLGCVIFVSHVNAQSLGKMQINGVSSKVDRQVSRQPPNVVIAQQIEKWKRQNQRTVNSSLAQWQIASSIENGSLVQVQARQIPRSDLTEVITSQTPLRHFIQPVTHVPNWLTMMLNSGAQVVTHLANTEGTAQASTWLVKLTSSANSLATWETIVTAIASAGFREHPVSQFGQAQQPNIQSITARYFSAPGGKQMSVSLNWSHGQPVILFSTHWQEAKHNDS
jgi:hypothetical protein